MVQTRACCRRVFQPPFIGHFPVIFQFTFGVHVYIVRGCRLRAKLIGAALRPATRLAGRRVGRTCVLSSDVTSSPPVYCSRATEQPVLSVRRIFPREHARTAELVTIRVCARISSGIFCHRPNVSQIYS